MSIRTKTLGVAVAFAAIAVAIPTAVQAYADPAAPADPTTTTTPVPVAKVPDPQGSGCDAYKQQVPTGPGSFASMATQSASEAIANNPDLSTFSAAISGKLNPAVNVVSALDGGPYIVFAPTNEAFAKLDEATLATLKNDPAVLLPTIFYHMVLGYVGPNTVAGTMATQDGRMVTVTGKNGDIKVNDSAKLVCSYTAKTAYIYMIDTVLTPGESGPSTSTSTTATSATETSSTETPTSTTSPSAEAPTTSATPTTTKAPTT